MRALFSAALITSFVASLTLAAPALGVNYAAHDSAVTAGSCDSANPCRLDYAVSSAAGGEEVVVRPGTYNVNYQVKATTNVNLHGVVGQAAPRLIGAVGHAYPTLELSAGGSASHLYIETSGQTALELAAGARGDRLHLFAKNVTAGAEAALLLGSVLPTTLTNSLALSEASGNAAGVNIVDDALAGTATLVNVTAIATDSNAWAIVSDLGLTAPILTNVLARGGEKDVYGQAGSLPPLVSTSSFRPTESAGFTEVGLNLYGNVDFADSDWRVDAGDPTIDAGVVDPLISGLKDLDGRLRLLGNAPDIGAFEWSDGVELPGPGGGGGAGDDAGETGGGLGAGDPSGLDRTELPALPPFLPPVLGSTVGIRTSAGNPLVQLPGTSEFVPLSAATSIPVGSVVDATNGRVTLTSVRDSSGRVQSGEFWGGVFQIRQTRGPKPLTELVLVGGDFSVCNGAARSRTAAGAARGRDAARVRRLWGRDRKGRFRTKGRNSHATVRGTVWLVEDRCDGTKTTVREGAVMVRDLAKRRSVLVKAGRSYLARAR